MAKTLFGLRPSIYISAGLAVGVGLWLLSGQVSGNDAPGADAPAQDTATAEQALPAVRFIESRSQLHRAELMLSAQTDYDRHVIVRAETHGRIIEVDMEETHPVQGQAVIARLEIEDRAAKLDQAKALVKQRETEFSAAQKLARKGFQSEVKRTEAEANLSAAKAQLRHAREELANTRIQAPFDGTIREQFVEIGDYVSTGDEIAEIVDLDPLQIIGQVSEREISGVQLGTQADIRLITGETLTGIVSRIAPVADTATRTFNVTVEVPNGNAAIRAGITAELRLPLETVKAHLIPASLLTLNDDGVIGVKAVNAKSTVEFLPISIVEDTESGMWVTGLPPTVRIISVGQEYVKHGSPVKAVPADKVG